MFYMKYNIIFLLQFRIYHFLFIISLFQKASGSVYGHNSGRDCLYSEHLGIWN